MTRCFTTVVLTSLTLLSFATTSYAEKAISLKGSIQPNAAKVNHFTVTVQLDVSPGWHTYDEVGEGSEVPTTLKLKLPEGVTAIGDWNRPSGSDGSTLHSLIYEGQVEFSKSVAVQPNAYGKTIDVIVSYQACTDQKCNRPQERTVTIAIPQEQTTGPSIFATPVRISVKDAPLNTVARKRFPSPGMFDVDDDGQAELVIGDLMGGVGVYQNLNVSGTGDPDWGSREVLKGIEGEAIETSNW